MSQTESIELGEVIDLLTGFPFKSENYTEATTDIRLLRGDNIIPRGLRWKDAKRWDARDITPYERYQLCEGDIVIAMDRPWIGAGLKWAQLKSEDVPSLLVQRVARIRAKDSVSQEYLTQIVDSDPFMEYLKSLQSGSAVPHISPTDIKRFTFDLPPLPEQRAIAAILSTWDDAIALTSRLIDALKRRKQALMQRLLTGQTRFPEFEGQEWEEIQLGELFGDQRDAIKVGPFGSQLRKSDLAKQGYKVYGQENVFRQDFEIGDRFISPEKYDELKSCSIKQGDFLVTMMGTIGKTAIVPPNAAPGIMDSHLMRLRLPDTFSARFLKQFFNFSGMKSQVRRGSVGGIMDGLSSKIVQSLYVPFPPLDEQQRLSDVLELADHTVTYLEEYADRLSEQKRGLMQRLLTGQVRVTNIESVSNG